MQLKLGSWAGGDSTSEGTVEWAGGKTDYSQAPFKMYVKSVAITNYNPACEYKYGDMTGSYESIDVITSGDSCKADGASSSSSTVSAVGSATSTAQSTATAAPTASQTVKAIDQTVSVSSTVTGSAYSVNTASISALNSGMQTSASATVRPSSGSNGTVSGASGPSSTSEIVSSTGAASINAVMAGGSLLSVMLGAMLL